MRGRCWREALKAQPDTKLFEENLADLRADGRERHGPWYFTLQGIVPQSWWPELEHIKDLDRRERLSSLLPLLFELEGPDAVLFAIALTG